MIRARQTCFCGLLRLPMIVSSRTRSSAVTVMEIPLRITDTRTKPNLQKPLFGLFCQMLSTSVRHDYRIDPKQSRDDFSCVLEPSHVGVAGGEVAVSIWGAWIPLDREKELRRRLVEVTAGEERATDYRECPANSNPRA